MVAAICCLLFLQTSPLAGDARLDRTVTFAKVAEPVDQAVKELGAAAQINLMTAEVIRREVLLLRLKDVKLRDAMDRIASTCGGRWVAEGQGYRLARDESYGRKQAEIQAGLRADIYRKAQAKEAERMKGLSPIDQGSASTLANKYAKTLHPPTNGAPPNYEEQMKVLGDLPGARLASRLSLRFDPQLLASLRRPGRTVFSTAPTPVEFRFPFEVDDLLDQFNQEQETWAEAAGKILNEDEPDFRDLTGAKRAVRLVVIASLQPWDETVQIEAKPVAADGSVIDAGSVSLRNLDPSPSDLNAFAPKPGEELIPIPAEDMTIVKILSQTLNGGMISKRLTDPAVREKIVRPDKFEPLGGAFSHVMLAAAEQRNLNVVCDAPDAAQILGVISMLGGKVSAASFLNTLRAIPLLGKPTVEDNWLTWRADQGLSLYGYRTDRKELAALLSSAQGSSVSLEALARYALSGGGDPNDLLYMVSLMLIAPESMRGDPENKVQWLRLLGHVLQAEGGDEVRPAKVLVTSLGPEAAALVHHMVYDDTGFGYSAIVPLGYADHIEREPAEKFPNGVPTNATLVVDVGNDTVAIPASGTTPDGRSTNPQPMTASELAAEQRNQESPQPNAYFIKYDMSKFRFGTRRTIHMELRIAQGVTYQMDLTERRVTDDPVPFEQLPEDFRAKFNAAYHPKSG